MVETISSQIWGSDEDVEVVGKIIPNIDYETNIHYLWKLAEKIGARMYRYNRNKDVKTWMANSRFNLLYRMNSFEVIDYLKRKDKLDHASFTYLEPIYRKGILIQSEQGKNNIFNPYFDGDVEPLLCCGRGAVSRFHQPRF